MIFPIRKTYSALVGTAPPASGHATMKSHHATIKGCQGLGLTTLFAHSLKIGSAPVFTPMSTEPRGMTHSRESAGSHGLINSKTLPSCPNCWPGKDTSAYTRESTGMHILKIPGSPTIWELLKGMGFQERRLRMPRVWRLRL